LYWNQGGTNADNIVNLWHSIIPAAIENPYCFKATIDEFAFAEPEEKHSAHAGSQIKVFQAALVRLMHIAGVRKHAFEASTTQVRVV
jgi:hypothetical protein